MLLTASTLVLLFAPQGSPDAPVARFRMAGAEAVVTADDLALELARRFHKTQRGREAVMQLVDFQLVREAAAAKNLMPTADQTRELAQRAAEELRAAGRDFDEVLGNMTLPEFEEYLALGLAHQNLVRDALGSPPSQPIGQDMLNLWLRQEREKAGVVEDPAQLPEGYAAKVGETYLTLLELGRLLRSRSGAAEREQFIRQIVVLRCLDAEAAAKSITVTEEEARAEVQARAAAAEQDARYGGLRLEQVLLSQGLTMETFARWPVLHAQIIERKLVDLEHSPEDLQQMLDDNRADILRRHGPRRRLGILFTRALEAPNELVPRDFTAAEAHQQDIRNQIGSGELPFAEAAKKHSEHGSTRVQGGVIGWHRQTSRTLPEPVIEAAFALSRSGVSDPVRTEEGYFLVKVLDLEPVPEDAMLIRGLHQDLQTALRQRILEVAMVELL